NSLAIPCDTLFSLRARDRLRLVPPPWADQVSVRSSRVWRCLMTPKLSSTPTSAGGASAASAVPEDLHALRAVVEGTAVGTGQEFFQSLVHHLAEAIDVHYAVAAEFPKAPPHVRTLAFWERDRLADNFEYDFTGTPCAEIVRGGLVHYPTGVSKLFP